MNKTEEFIELEKKPAKAKLRLHDYVKDDGEKFEVKVYGDDIIMFRYYESANVFRKESVEIKRFYKYKEKITEIYVDYGITRIEPGESEISFVVKINDKNYFVDILNLSILRIKKWDE